MKIVSSLTTLLMLLFQTPGNPAQQPRQQTAKASIEGSVLRSGSGEPLARAQVTLMRILPPPPPPRPGEPASPPTPAPQIPAGMTEREGKFSFTDLEPGQYRLRVQRNGYAQQEYGQKTLTSPGTPINLTAGQDMKDVVFRMVAAGIVTGRVRDGNGEAVAGVQVSLLRSVFTVDGQRSFTTAGESTTDDRGEYRVFWVPPGRYIVGVSARPGAVSLLLGISQNVFADHTFPATYYPGTLDPTRASSIEIQPGTEVSGIDMVIVQPMTFRVRGRVVDQTTGKPPQTANVSISPRQEVTGQTIVLISSIAGNGTYNSADGSFEVRNVIPGTYWLRAQTSTSLNAPLSPAVLTTARTASDLLDSVLLGRNMAQVPVEVIGSDVEGVVLTMTPGVSIPIHLSADGQELSSIGYDRVRVLLRPTAPGANASTQRGSFGPDGNSRLEGVPNGEYRITVSLPSPDVYVKEARFERTDVLNEPWEVTDQTSGALTIVLSTKGGQVEGRLIDALSQPVGGNQVALIPDQNTDRPELYKSANTDQDGHFLIRGIPPGGYRLFSWEALEPNAYYDPEVLSQYEAQGKPVRIQESGKETVELKIIPAPK